MKRRQFMALTMATMMMMSVVVGCGKTNNDPKPSSDANTSADAKTNADADAKPEVEDIALKVWAPEEDLEITQQMCDAFNEAHPEYNCTFDVSIIGIDESCNALETDSDVAADVFMLPSGSINQLVDAGLIYPITYDDANVKALYSEAAVEACSIGDNMYGVPASPNTWFMYYDTSKYTEDEVKSLETMMAKDLGADVANFSCNISNSWYTEAFFYAAGCTLYGEDGTNPDDCTWNNEAGFEAGKYLINLANNPKYVEDLDGIAGAKMKEGTLAALCSGTWAAPDIKEALGENYGACALPTINLNGKECQLSNFADYKCFAVKSNTAHPLAAQQLAEWFGNEENQLLRYETSVMAPTCLSLLENPALSEDIATQALMAQSEFATPQPAITQVSEYWTPVAALGEGIIYGDVTEANLQESLDSVVNSVTSKLVN